MYSDQTNNRQKVIASFIVIMAVVLVTVGVSALNHKDTGKAPATTTSNTAPGTGTAHTSTSTIGTYKDGTYTASDNYSTPGGLEGITLNLTVQGGTVTDASVSHKTNNHESKEYQAAFSSSFKTFVVGKSIDGLNLSRISGASLTTEGFNEALQQIKSQAQAT